MSFGQFISPELFDKDLPPDTPIRKGAVPVSELKKGAAPDSPRLVSTFFYLDYFTSAFIVF